jgi:hypothetical protein
MSGKAPPRGPRALQVPNASGPGTASSSKLGAAPPTGPRSLLNGQASQNGTWSSQSNGVHNRSFAPPTGPKGLAHVQKGKQSDLAGRVHAGASVNGVGANVNDRCCLDFGCVS